MIKDTNTTAIDAKLLLVKTSKNASDGNNIISGKINPIINKKALDIISGGIETWGEIWGDVWFAMSW